ncbi:MAG TPA: hypothetical protein VFG86_26800 [Chloroflexota bacterium]|nr:hypothetical protein [Chloroflexota bacterium]
MADERATRRFFAWKTDHPHQAEDPMAVWAAAWKAGGADMLSRTARIAELTTRLDELLSMLRDLEMAAEIEAEIAEGSSYWVTER